MKIIECRNQSQILSYLQFKFANSDAVIKDEDKESILIIIESEDEIVATAKLVGKSDDIVISELISKNTDLQYIKNNLTSILKEIEIFCKKNNYTSIIYNSPYEYTEIVKGCSYNVIGELYLEDNRLTVQVHKSI